MVRVKRGVTARAKHKKVLGLAKGYWMTRHKQFKKAKEAVLHAGQYAFNGRKMKKRDFRSLWITRLNAALRTMDISYGTFIHSMKVKNVQLDRKVMADIATNHPKAFTAMVNQTK